MVYKVMFQVTFHYEKQETKTFTIFLQYINVQHESSFKV